MAIIKKSTNNKCWRGKNEPSSTVGVNKLVQPLWRTVQRFLKKLKIELSIPEKTITQNSKDFSRGRKRTDRHENMRGSELNKDPGGAVEKNRPVNAGDTEV